MNPDTLVTEATAGYPSVAPATFLMNDPDPRQVWRKYCGFLELSMREFMDIQEQLLLEQIELVHASPLGRRLFRGTVPHSVAEFRANVPLTTYGDYVPFLGPGHDADTAGGDSVIWAHTTGAQADFKWVPYTQRGLERFLDNIMSALILAAANRPGEVNIWPGAAILYNTPARPYVSGFATFGLGQRFGMQGIPDPAVVEHMDFKEKVRLGFHEALGKPVDAIISMTSVLVKVGEGFTKEARSSRQSTAGAPRQPRALWRAGKALLKSKLLRRDILPKDLWPVKAIIGWGIDTPFFRDQVKHYWGRVPFEMYACTEGGVMGMQTWERKGVVFNPYADFYEFIPIEEALKSRQDDRHRPQTVLLDEVKPGQVYEIVLTNFYGMAFIRYRVGHYVQFLPAESGPSPTRLPQFTFIGRSDDRIDLAGFTRVDEKSIWDALSGADLDPEAWTARKEFEDDAPILHVYIELKKQRGQEEVQAALHANLKRVDPFYRDLESMLDIQPLRVTVLSAGSFDRFYERRRQAGYELGRRTPPRMNPTEEDVADLLGASKEAAQADSASRRGV
jgi:hypothetical protein